MQHLKLNFGFLINKKGHDYWPERFNQFDNEDMRKLNMVWVVRRVEDKSQNTYILV